MVKSRQVAEPSARETSAWPERIAWYGLLASIPLVALVTSLGIGRPWGYYALTEEPYHTPKLLLLALVMVVTTIAWLVDVVVSQRGLRWSLATGALAVFAGLVALSTALSPELATSFFGASSLLTGGFTWLLCLWVGVLASHYVVGGRRLQSISRVSALSGAAVGAIALLQAAGADPLGTRMQESFAWMVKQGMATTGNPNYTGALLVVPFVVALALAVSEKDARWRWTMAAAAAVCVSALFITLTRAAWIGAGVGVVALMLLVPKAASDARRNLRNTALAMLGMLAAGVLLAGPAAVAARFTKLAGGLDAFSAGRLTLWGETLRVVTAHPLLGTGADRLGVAAYPLQTNVAFEGTSRLVMQDPHSLPLYAAAIFGIPAALALIAALGLALYAGIAKLRAEVKVSPATIVYAGWVAALAGLVATILLSVTTVTLIFIMFLSVGVVIAPTLKPASGRLWPTWVVGVLALLIALTGLWGTVQANRAGNALVSARITDSESNLKRAILLTPWDSRIRTEYLSRKIGAMQPILTGEDATAAYKVVDLLDSEIRLAQLDYPNELLLHRLRIKMHESMKDARGYRAALHRDALDNALEAFPNDPEFKKWSEEFEAAQ